MLRISRLWRSQRAFFRPEPSFKYWSLWWTSSLGLVHVNLCFENFGVRLSDSSCKLRRFCETKPSETWKAKIEWSFRCCEGDDRMVLACEAKPLQLEKATIELFSQLVKALPQKLLIRLTISESSCKLRPVCETNSSEARNRIISLLARDRKRQSWYCPRCFERLWY